MSFANFTGGRPWNSTPLPTLSEIRAVHVMHRCLVSPLGHGQPSRLISVAAHLQTHDGHARYCPTISAEAWSTLLDNASGYKFSESPDNPPDWVV